MSYMSEDDYDAKRTLLKSEEQDILKKIDFLLTKNWDFKLNYELNKLKNRLNENTILNHNYDENDNSLKIKLIIMRRIIENTTGIISRSKCLGKHLI